MSQKAAIFGIIALAIALAIGGWVWYGENQSQREQAIQTNQPEDMNQNDQSETDARPEIKEEDLVYTPLADPKLDTRDWKAFRSKTSGVEFKYPATWEVSVSEREPSYILKEHGEQEIIEHTEIIVVRPRNLGYGDGTGYSITVTERRFANQPGVIAIFAAKPSTISDLLTLETQPFTPASIAGRKAFLYDRDQNPRYGYPNERENSGVFFETIFLETNSRYFFFIKGSSYLPNSEQIKAIYHQSLFTFKFFEPTQE